MTVQKQIGKVLSAWGEWAKRTLKGKLRNQTEKEDICVSHRNRNNQTATIYIYHTERQIFRPRYRPLKSIFF